MQQKYEYKFVRLNGRTKSEDYQQVIADHACQGWRLVQIFAPGAGGLGASPNFCELVFEHEIGSP